MPFDPFKHHRRSIRLRGYDYAQPGAYFVTINTHPRPLIFSEITGGVVRLNEPSEIEITNQDNSRGRDIWILGEKARRR